MKYRIEYDEPHCGRIIDDERETIARFTTDDCAADLAEMEHNRVAALVAAANQTADLAALVSAANRAAIVLGGMESELRAGERRTLYELRDAIAAVAGTTRGRAEA